jgi:methanogenic corrinoid protein MtbC1
LERSERLASQITEMQYKLQPELLKRFGENGRKQTLQDTLYNLKYLSESVQMKSPLLFANYITWLRTLLAGHKVTTEEIAVNLRCMTEAIKQQIKPELCELIVPIVDDALKQVSLLLAESNSLLGTDHYLVDEARQYTELLLRGDRHTANAMIMNIQQKISIEDIYLHIFQKSQYEIGRLWQTNQINVAQEHYCTAATQMIMSQLSPYIFSIARNGRQMVTACVGEELHEIGLRMVCDFFEMDGWDTYYLGANVPKRSVIDSIVDRQADIMAISATMSFHVYLVKELIDDIRNHEQSRHTKIIVGGLPFNIDPELWKNVGADGHAYNAKDAISQARELMKIK